MSNTPFQDCVREFALAQVGAAYVMGATAQKCTPGMRRSLAGGRSSDYADGIINNCQVLSGKKSTCDGCKYNGRLAFDCAQLSRFAAKAGGIELPSGSNSQWTKVAWGKRGEIAAMPMDVVCFVYHEKNGNMTHVGVYLGDGMVADARGHASGVLHSHVTSYPWTHYAIPAEIATEAQLATVSYPTYGDTCRPTLRKGSKGADVCYLQQLLNEHLYQREIEEDGVFGSATQDAVKEFQAANGLTADGVVGPLTWEALYGVNVPVQDDGAVDAPEDDPDESSAWDALAQEMRQACGQMAELQQRMAALIEAADEMNKI